MAISIKDTSIESDGNVGLTSNSSATNGAVVTTTGLSFGSSSPATSLDMSGTTDSFKIPSGTTAQRPAVTNLQGSIRYNTNNEVVEYCDGTNWIGIGIRDGLSYSSSAANMVNIKSVTSTTTDGLYWINNDNANGGQPFQAYADMNTDGGGWLLVVAANAATHDWNSSTVFLRNQTSVNIGGPYSILGWADYFKQGTVGGVSGAFDYMLGASSSGTSRANWTSNGGIFRTNVNYSITNASSSSTNVSVRQWFSGGYGAYNSDGIEQGVPFYTGQFGNGGTLTTNRSAWNSDWWGTIITNSTSYNTAPWESSYLSSPANIWYWIR